MGILRGVDATHGQQSGARRAAGLLESEPVVLAFIAPRGIGLTAWDASEKKQTHIRRRFYLLGQTLEGMQAWDVRRGLQAVRSLEDLPVRVQAQGPMAGVTAYACLFEPPTEQILLLEPSYSHRTGPHLLNVQRYLDLPQTMALIASDTPLMIYDRPEPWNYPQKVLLRLGSEGRLIIQPPPQEPAARLLVGP